MKSHHTPYVDGEFILGTGKLPAAVVIPAIAVPIGLKTAIALTA